MVQRRDLVETDIESGTLSYADPQTVFNRLSGTITWLPQVGHVVKAGQPLYRVDGEPVLLMNGSVPAYRELAASDSDGADIEQLNRNLVALGFAADGIVIDDEWQPATSDGVELLQASLGESETGSLPLGQIVFLPGDQLVSTLDATVGSTGSGGATPAAAAATDASTPLVADTEFVGLSTTTTISATATPPYAQPPAPVTRTRPTKRTRPKGSKRSKAKSAHRADGSGSLAGLTALLKAEVAQLKAATAALRAAKSSSVSNGRSSSSSGSGSSSSRSSGGGGSATAILQTSSTRLVVTVDLSASSQSEAVIAEPVTVELPAGNRIGGTITTVSSVAQASSSSANSSGGGGGGGGGGGAGASSSTVPVTITLKGHHRGAGLDQAAVSVNFAQAKAKHVLSVPVTALIATSGGNYAVQEATGPYTLLPVTTGLFAAGYVQISGVGIRTGLPVTDSQG
jgi:hypothetical protein